MTFRASRRLPLAIAALLAALHAGCDNGHAPEHSQPCPYDTLDIGLQYRAAGPFSEGLAVVRLLDGRYGAIDTTGALLWTTPYSFYLDSGYFIDWCEEFREGMIICDNGAYAPDTRYGILDRNGNTVLPPSFFEIGYFHEGLACAQRSRDDKYGYLDATGAWAIQPVYSDALGFSEGLAAVSIDGNLKGYIDRSGSQVIPPTFLQASWFSEGLARVITQKRTCAYIDRSGRIVINLDSLGTEAECRAFSEGLAAVRKSLYDDWYFIDRTGRIVIRTGEDDVGDFHCGLARIDLDIYYNHSGPPPVTYMDRSGNRRFTFEEGGDFRNGYASVAMDCGRHGYRGLVDSTGTLVIPCMYYALGSYSNGFVNIEYSGPRGQYGGHINLRGELLGEHR